MRGVIVEAEVYARDGASERVLVFLELEDTGDESVLHIRRSYAERASVLTASLDDVERAIAALKREHDRQPPAPIPGQVELEVDADGGEA